MINCIIVLANTVKQQEDYKGPIIEDASKTKDLWAESLVMNELKEEDDTETPVVGLNATHYDGEIERERILER